MRLGFNLGMARGGGAVRRASSLALEALPTFRGLTLDAAPLVGSVRGWVNDPPYADRVGAVRAFGQDRAFADLFTFSRASKATEFDAYGAVNELPVNALRQGFAADGTPAGWLIEGASTNYIVNPRMEGAAAGTPGTAPTSWAANVGTVGDWTRQIVGVGTEANGLPYIDVRVTGTNSTGSTQLALNWTPTTSAAYGPMTAGQSGAMQMWTKIVAGSVPAGGAVQLGLAEYDAAKASLSSWRVQTIAGLDGTWKRFNTLMNAINAACAFAAPQIWISVPGSAAIDLTLRIGGLMFEANTYFASSLMLPPVGSPGVSTSAADVLSIQGAAFGQIFGNALAGFVIVDVSIAAINNLARLFDLTDGSTANTLSVYTASSGGLITPTSVAGTGGNGPSSGAAVIAANTAARVGLRWGGGLPVALVLNGSLTTASPALPLFDRLVVGNRALADRPLNGRILGLRCGNFAPSDAAFQAACTLGADVGAALGA